MLRYEKVALLTGASTDAVRATMDRAVCIERMLDRDGRVLSAHWVVVEDGWQDSPAEEASQHVKGTGGSREWAAIDALTHGQGRLLEAYVTVARGWSHREYDEAEQCFRWYVHDFAEGTTQWEAICDAVKNNAPRLRELGSCK